MRDAPEHSSTAKATGRLSIRQPTKIVAAMLLNLRALPSPEISYRRKGPVYTQVLGRKPPRAKQGAGPQREGWRCVSGMDDYPPQFLPMPSKARQAKYPSNPIASPRTGFLLWPRKVLCSLAIRLSSELNNWLRLHEGRPRLTQCRQMVLLYGIEIAPR